MTPIDPRPAPQSNRTVDHRVDGPARRAAIVLLVAALLALLGAGLFLLMGVLLPQLASDAEVRRVTAELRDRYDVDLAMMLKTMAGVTGVYAVAAATLGVGLLTGGPAWQTSALTFCCVVGGLLALLTATAVATANAGGAIEGLLLIAPHALAVWWLLGTPTAPVVRVAMPAPSAYRPMQDYYTPPVPPRSTRG